MNIQTLNTTQLSVMDTSVLREELAKVLTITAEHMMYLAQIWRELESRGEDLSDLKAGLAVYLPGIAAGHVDAHAVVKFAGQKTLLNAISSLALSDQRRLSDGQNVQLVIPDEHGELITEERPAHALNSQQVKQVFDGTKIRSIAEQKDWISGQQKNLVRRTKKISDKISFDTKKGMLVVGRTRVTPAEIIAALSDVYASDIKLIEGLDTKPTVTHLTEEERSALRVNAAKADMSIQDVIRVALMSQGLLTQEKN